MRVPAGLALALSLAAGGCYFDLSDALRPTQDAIPSADAGQDAGPESPSCTSSFRDEFAALDGSAWLFGPYQSIVSSSYLRSFAPTGSAGYAAAFGRAAATVSTGMRVRFAFAQPVVLGSVEAYSGMHYGIESGVDPSYRRVAVVQQFGLIRIEYNDGTTAAEAGYHIVDFLPPLPAAPDTWYVVSIAVDDAVGFTIAVGDRVALVPMSAFTAGTAGRAWRFAHWPRTGSESHIDWYEEGPCGSP